MKDEEKAGGATASWSVMARCVWRARVLGWLTEPGMGPLWLGMTVYLVGLLGWIAYDADPAAGALWLGELMTYGMAKTARAPGAALEALASGAPWAWVGAACLAARVRWLWLGLSRDASQEDAALRASVPVFFWMAVPWLAAAEANRRLALRALSSARNFAASSRTLPAQFAAGLWWSLVAGAAMVDGAALAFNAVLVWLMAAAGVIGVARGDSFTAAHAALFAMAAAVWIKQGALQAARGQIRALWQIAKTKAGALRAKPAAAKRSPWAALGRAKASLARGLLESAASDGTLSEAERNALLSATKRKGVESEQKPSSLRL